MTQLLGSLSNRCRHSTSDEIISELGAGLSSSTACMGGAAVAVRVRLSSSGVLLSTRNLTSRCCVPVQGSDMASGAAVDNAQGLLPELGLGWGSTRNLIKSCKRQTQALLYVHFCCCCRSLLLHLLCTKGALLHLHLLSIPDAATLLLDDVD